MKKKSLLKTNYFNLTCFKIILLLLLTVLRGFAQPVKFYSSDRELSNSMITKIIQDKQGFIWIATEDGLNRFDGLKFKSYRNNREDSSSLTSNFVSTLYTDRQGKLWIGCINGLMVYHPDNESFREIELFRDTIRRQPHVKAILESRNGDMLIATSGHGLAVIKKGTEKGYADLAMAADLSSLFLECLYEDSYGRLWIGSENEGINLFDPSTRRNKIYRHEPSQPNSLSSNYITAIGEDNQGNILIGTLNGGLNKYNQNDDNFTIIQAESEAQVALPVKSLFLDGKKNLWIGTSGKGLWKLNPLNGKLEPKEIITSRFDVGKSKIHTITEDNEGNLWLGIFQKGTLMITDKPNHFNTYAYQRFGQKSIGSGCIMGISEGIDGQMWVCSDSEGLYKVNVHTGTIQNFPMDKIHPESGTGTFTSVYADKKGIIWIGTLLEGFIRFDPVTRQCKYFKHLQGNDNSLSNDKVQCIVQDDKGHLWIGTSGGGLNRYDPATGKFIHFFNTPEDLAPGISNNWINTIFCDSEGLIWIGTYKRLSIYDPATGNFRMLSTSNGLLPNNIVFTITEDKEGKIWIGTNEGMACYDKKTDRSMFFTTNDGLSNNVISAILEDDSNQMWIATHLGISCYSKKDSSFNNFSVYDGLQGNEFRRNSACKTGNGEIFFGGINGFTWFDPKEIITSNEVPEVYLTDLILFNKAVRIGEKLGKRIILKKSIEETDTLKLSWQDKTFSIEFSIIGFSNPERYAYQYRLDGFDNNWINTWSVNRRATYTNLGPGKYIFNARARDKETVSGTKKLFIWITPPWWATTWFRVLCLVLILLLLIAIYRYLKTRIRHRNELLRLEHLEKINEEKLQFFTNISHEIRTPLTLIAGPLEKLIAENRDRKLDKSYRLMSQSTQRLLRLVNQLLDIRKIDRGQIYISYAPTNLIAFISEIMQAFDYLSEKKQISFTFRHEMDKLEVWIDPNNFDKVIYNVLANAFKFTPDKGIIEIRLITGHDPDAGGFLQNFAEISVSDSGHGIEDEQITRIFERFYQTGNHPNIVPGTGIGLHLAKTLTEMQFGSISAENRPDRKGSIFRIRIPLGRNHVKDEAISTAANKPASEYKSAYLMELSEHSEDMTSDASISRPKSKTNYRIVIADDDVETRNYLTAELGDNFRVTLCSNGKEALESVLQEKPDLVISDILMPQMDGITLCRKLKSNPSTSNLPVMLLTARPEDEVRNQGLDTGADAYMVKPFNTDLLKRTIFNLLVNRERIKISYSPGGNINAGKIPFTSTDEMLINRIVQIIEERIADPALNTEVLSREIGMSRVHLFRKMKQITGQSAGDFIRKIRMQKAAQLLAGNKGFIKEIAFETGFSSLSHFSHSFREFYGIAPGEYAERNVEK